MAVVHARRLARERAVALLYEAEAKALTPAEVVAALPVAPDPYAGELVEGVGERIAEIDDLLRRHATDWPLERMAAIDRAVLRMAAYELLAQPDLPIAVVIDEAVELAKTYSTENSGRFVNGVLSAIAAEVRTG